ncbi:hypothetical protein [Methylobacterium organophilum]|uniref:Uncharacterized protein n=1 Tax=Methylobacterium organophilum TaxID=410 RepID=A0ABQ4T4V4_METOR|nr:hypothetical protein [Methylobacterium organophilum]GJE25667.1 hypothetical protein LKMONMHP_0505 [Methylobacterium organophilum]
MSYQDINLRLHPAYETPKAHIGLPERYRNPGRTRLTRCRFTTRDWLSLAGIPIVMLGVIAHTIDQPVG